MMARDERRLTPLAAHTFLGIASLTARVAELRVAFGEESISSSWDHDNFKRRFKSYFLTSEQRERIKARLTA
jgi:hypothetical protein